MVLTEKKTKPDHETGSSERRKLTTSTADRRSGVTWA